MTNKSILLLLGIFCVICLGSFYFFTDSTTHKLVTTQETNTMILVLAAPSIHNQYYSSHFEDIVEYQIGYALKVIANGQDEIRILVDKDTKEKYSSRLPEEILIIQGMEDIWVRDFSTVNPYDPIQFIYTDASMSTSQSKKTQEIFSLFANKINLQKKKVDYILDGGNIVDNYAGKVITTTRFLEDNGLTYEEGKAILKDILQVEHVAIIPPDDEILAHSDGMVSWLDTNILAVNDYSSIDPDFHNEVLEELSFSFPSTKIVILPVVFEDKGIDTTKGIGSACGININAVLTNNALYVPTFGKAHEAKALEIIKSNTSKKVIEIDARKVCGFGGSVRCTTWQINKGLFDKF